MDVDALIDALLEREGGFTDDASDRGHQARVENGDPFDSRSTNRGITQATYSEFLGRQATDEEMRNLPEEDARAIYKKSYFLEPGIDKLPEELQPLMFDMAVNHGVDRAVKMLQEQISQLGTPVDNDGNNGPVTQQAARSTWDAHGNSFGASLVDRRAGFYDQLIASDPSQQKFAAGWNNHRVEPFRTAFDAPGPKTQRSLGEPVSAVAEIAAPPVLTGFANVDPSVARVDGRLIHDPAQDVDNSPGTFEQLSAAMQLENVAVNIAMAAQEPDFEPATDFDLTEHLDGNEMADPGAFLNAGSLAELNHIRRKRESEAELRRVMAEGPLNEFVATAIAVLTDPVSYIPIAGQAGTGARLGTKAAIIAGKGAAEVALSETILQSAQVDRTIEESLGAILMGGAFAGGVGAVGAKLKSNKASAAAAHRQGIADFQALYGQAANPEASTVGAMVSPHLDPTLTVPAPSGGLGQVLNKLPAGLRAPSIEMMYSGNHVARELALKLGDVGIVTKGQVEGSMVTPPAYLTRVRAHDSVSVAADARGKAAYADYKARIKREGGKPRTRAEFSKRASMVARRGDKSKVPEIQAWVQDMRKQVLDFYKDHAIGVGLLPKGVKVAFADTYFTRAFNRGLMMAEAPQWKRAVADFFVAEGKVVDREDAYDLATQAYNQIQGAPAGRTPFVQVTSKRGPIKERVLDVPDTVLERWLNNDFDEVIQGYIKTMAHEIEFVNTFGDIGQKVNDDFIARIRDETARLADEPGKGGKPKTPQELLKLEKKGLELEALADKLLNQARGMGQPADPRWQGLKSTSGTVRNFNFMRSLGTVVVSSMSDPARLIATQGVQRTFGHAIGEMVSGMKAYRMSKKDAKLMGAAVDVVLGSRTKAIFDTTEAINTSTKLGRAEEFSGAAAKVFGKSTLLPFWNDFWKSTTSVMSTTQILRAAKQLAVDPSKLSKGDLAKLREGGIDDRLARLIAKQEEHWQDGGHATVANIDKWTNPEASRALTNAVLRDVDNTVITPNLLDAPLWTSTEMGKTFFQFKRFGWAATNRILLSGLQKHDMAQATAISTAIAAGVMITALKDIASTGEIREREARAWAVDAVDRSGVLGMYFELDQSLAKLAGTLPIGDDGIGLSPASAIGGRPPTKFAQRGLVSQLAGPTAGMLEDVIAARQAVFDGSASQRDLHRVRRLIPWQNHFLLTNILNELEKASGLPES